MENIIRNLKEIHPEAIILIKIGSFYHAYGKDACIMAYIFGYQIKSVDKGYKTCGMPLSALNKVMKTLEDKKINYLVLIKSQNYSEEAKIDFDVNNKYKEIYERAYKNIKLKKRISDINEILLENIESPNIKEILLQMEEYLDAI